MADKLLIVLVNTDPGNPQELDVAFSQAIVAAAMEYEVEIIFTGRAGELAKSGFSAAISVPAEKPCSVYDLIQEAHRAGVTLKVCTPVTGLGDDDLIDEIDETVGGAYLISEAMDDATVTFTF